MQKWNSDAAVARVILKKPGTPVKWVGLATLAAYAALGSKTLAVAAPMAIEAAKEPASTQLPVRRFRIGEAPLTEALEAYKAQSGVAVTLALTREQLAGLHSSSVSGLLTPEAALRVLLGGTGLNFHFVSGDAVEVGVRLSESVDVTAAVADSVGLSKFTEPLLDTPQSIGVVPQFVMHDQGVSTLRDALRNVPGISLAAGEAGAQGDNLTIRGFTARNDIFLDGIRDFGSYYRDSFNYEQVEVLEGPAGIQFGRGSTGGVINQESKVPLMERNVHVDAQFGTDLTRRITADIDEPLDGLNGAALRVNAMAVESGVAGRPFAENRRFGFAPSISLGLNSATRLTISYFHLTESDTPDYGLPWFFNQLAPGVDRHAYFGFPDQNYLKTNDDVMTLKADHDFNSHVNVRTIARAANYPRSAQITEPQICSNASASVPVGGYVSALPTSSVTGAVCAYMPAVAAPSTVVVNRNQIQVKSDETDLWDQTEVTAHFKVAGQQNNFVGGVEGGQETSNPIRYSYTINKLNTVPSASLTHPDAGQVFSGTGYVTSIVHTKSDSVGVYFVDTVHLGRFFEASGGVRWDRFDTGYNLYQPTPPAGATVTAAVPPLSRVDAMPSYRAAMVFKPNKHGSVYFDWGTSFNPAAESLALSVGLANSNLLPEANETYEAGAKYSLLGERLMLDGAWFQTRKNNARETDPSNSNNIVNAGNQMVRGVQFSVVGRMGRGTDIIAGYAFLHSEVVSSQFFPASVGFPLANVPKQTFNLFVTHRLPFGLNGGLGGNYVAARTASSTVPYVPLTFGPKAAQGYQVLSTGMKQVPGYWVFNAMLRKPVTDRLELQANVYNLLNRFYIDQPHPSHLVPGAGMTALIGFSWKF